MADKEGSRGSGIRRNCTMYTMKSANNRSSPTLLTYFMYKLTDVLLLRNPRRNYTKGARRPPGSDGALPQQQQAGR